MAHALSNPPEILFAMGVFCTVLSCSEFGIVAQTGSGVMFFGIAAPVRGRML